MNYIKFFFASVFMTLCTLSVMADEVKTTPADEEAYDLGYYPQPYWFIQAQGGIGTTFTSGKNFFKLASPTVSVAFGRMFSPVVGARIHVNAWESKSSLPSIGQTYKFNYINSNLDVMLNINNIFSKTHNHLVNVYVLGGVGLAYAWKNDDFTNLRRSYGGAITEDISNAWGEGTSRKSLLSHNIRFGTLVDFSITKNWSVGIEADINNLSDRFNSKYKNSNDWMLTAQASVTYKFGYKKATRPTPPIPVVQPAPEVKPEPKPVPPPAPKLTPLTENMKFQLRETDNSESKEKVLQKVVEWAQKNPDKGILVEGYADKGTGNPTINAKYAQQRADNAAAALVAKGIAKERIEVKSFGDTVQPFPNNDDNRCVLIYGK